MISMILDSFRNKTKVQEPTGAWIVSLYLILNIGSPSGFDRGLDGGKVVRSGSDGPILTPQNQKVS